LSDIRPILGNIEQATGVKPALIYVDFVPSQLASSPAQPGVKASDNDQLEILVVTAQGAPVRKVLYGVTRQQVIAVAERFKAAVSNPRSKNYLPDAQQLYQWIIAPVEADLQARGIQNLSFIMNAGLRSVPFAALHDGKQFLVEKYSAGLMPSISLTDTRYVPLKNARVLAMGAEQFTELNDLPAVPVEVSTIASSLWSGQQFLNSAFTIENLQRQRQQQPYGILHLATHGEFKPGKPDNSYIQFWNTRLGLDKVRQLGLNNPPVELLVLSACRTALGDVQAELGFAGFAFQAGVKTALASLWYVSDEGTLGLMTDFYSQLKQTPIKAEALRQAQVDMLSGRVRLEKGELRTPNLNVPLPPALAQLGDGDLKHPFYWAAFTMIGNPW